MMCAEDLRALLAVAFPAGSPRLGFGSGDLFGGDRGRQSRALVEAAFEHGFRYFDTARLYGNGTAEGVLGEVLSRRRGEVVIASKAGILPWSMQWRRRALHKADRLVRAGGPALRRLVPEPPAPAALHGAFAPARLRRSVETSLRRLRTDYLDILLLHECAAEDALSADVRALLDRLRRDGKVRFTGIATTEDETVRILASTPDGAAVVQAPADAIGRQWDRYGTDAGHELVTHSTLRPALASIADRAREDAGFVARFESLTGVDPRDRGRLPALLLAHALRRNPDGVALYSTLRVDRLAATSRALRDEPFAADRFDGLETALAPLRSTDTTGIRPPRRPEDASA